MSKGDFEWIEVRVGLLLGICHARPAAAYAMMCRRTVVADGPAGIYFCAALASFLIGCRDVTIAHHQTEHDANTELVVLSAARISAEKQRATDEPGLLFDIRVPASREIEAVSILVDYGFPRNPSGSGTEDEKVAPLRGRELSNTLILALRSIKGVIDVQAVVREARGGPPFDAEITVAYAHHGSNLSPISALDVKRFVSAMVPEVPQDRVTVRMLPVDVSEQRNGRDEELCYRLLLLGLSVVVIVACICAIRHRGVHLPPAGGAAR